MPDFQPLDRPSAPPRRGSGLRWVILAGLYALAIVFAVLFSPSFGLVPATPEHADTLAQTPAR